MNSAIENLQSRGFFAQCSSVEGLSRLMDEEPVTFYIGIDPTASSAHIGHMVPFFALKHLVNAGHRGIALMGAGTARIGDPSFRSETRQILSYEQLDKNAASILAQLDHFVGFDGQKTLTANNKDWLAGLNYIDFLREIGVHFSVNRMLSMEAYKIRMETGLSFIEFNYPLLQSYDFLELYRQYGCRLQIGGDDQWGNILSGVDLVRRMEGAEVFALTFPLVTTADGNKMGKTLKGALFLDPAITTPYEFFQYWRNVHDADVRKFMLLFTFLPIGEVDQITAADKNPNEAKERLAWEITALIHGKDEADKAMAGARAAFGASSGGDKSAMPHAKVSREKFKAGYNIVDLFCDAKLAESKSEARRLVEQGGAFVSPSGGGDLISIADVAAVLGEDSLNSEGEMILRAGKKRYCLLMTQ
jgi:tyrosyl-tRNA synthetase